MLVSADWVVPVTHRPIRDGAVLLEGDTITAIGPLDSFTGSQAGSLVDSEQVHFPGCAIMPGLVNGHTHLSLSAMQDLLEPAAFEEWLPRLVAAMRSWTTEDFAASARLGAWHCLQAGVTVVGDIAYGPESATAAAEAGLGGVAYWEVLGITAPKLFAELERLGFPSDCGEFGPRMRCGLSPHSIYTSSPGLLDAVHRAGIDLGIPVAIHLAESAAEVRLSVHGDGPLAQTAKRVIGEFETPGATPVAYLDRLGILDGTTVVHMGETDPADIPLLAPTVRGVIACPRSNSFLGNRAAPVDRFVEAGIPVGVGTDSSASNDDLDLFEEVRALRDRFPGLGCNTLLRFATVEGAVALGEEMRFGALDAGMAADLAVFKIGDSDDPETDLVSRGGRETLQAVMTSGVWRIGASAEPALSEADRVAAQAATEKARAALLV